MALADIDRSAVIDAIEEFDRLGRDTFLRRHGFGRSRAYLLRYRDKLYDSKAIIGVAHGYLGYGSGPISPTQFSRGEATVARILRSLGFEVQVSAVPPSLVMADNVSPEGFAYWWVNNEQTYSHEIGGNYLWSPTERSDRGAQRILREHDARAPRRHRVRFRWGRGQGRRCLIRSCDPRAEARRVWCGRRCMEQRRMASYSRILPA